jgi:hypothetical protein
MELGAWQRTFGALVAVLGASSCTGDPQAAAVRAGPQGTLGLESTHAGKPAVAGAAVRAQVSVTSADRAAARGVTANPLHVAAPVNGPPGARAKARAFNAGHCHGRSPAQSGGGRPRYPADLSSMGGPTVQQAVFHAVYVLTAGQTPDNTPVPATWGDPEGFLRDLGQSEYIRVVDQYTNSTQHNRYTVGTSLIVNVESPDGGAVTQLAPGDDVSIVHAAAAFLGVSGLGHVFHLFLTPGTDVCLQPGYCYSPDNPATFAFCAYHGAANFSDLGQVAYTVEPYQNLQGCTYVSPTPNGRLVDSTDSALAHETIETITDPLLDGWKNLSSQLWLGYEIADECQFVSYTPLGLTAPTSTIGAHTYAVQSIYSNADHACVTEPKR